MNDWLANLIAEVRKRKHAKGNLFDLPEACQVFGIATTQPNCTVILVVKHDDAPASTWSWGPKPVHLVHEAYGELLKHELWQRPYKQTKPFVKPKEPGLTMRRVAESAVRQVHSFLQRSIFHDSNQSGFSAMLLPSDSALWMRKGRPDTIDYQEWLEPLQPAAQQSGNASEPKPVPPSAPQVEEYSAVECSPRLRIGPSPVKHLWQILGDDLFDFPDHKPILETDFAGFHTKVSHEGLIAFRGASPELARKLAMPIMVALWARGRKVRPVRDEDIASLTWSSGWQGSFPVRDETDRRFAREPDWIPVDEFQKALTHATTLNENVASDELSFLLECQWHLANREFAQSMLFSWAILERWADRQWGIFLDSRQATGERRKKLRQKLIWSLDHNLEAMELAGAVPAELGSRIRTFRKARNKTFHDGTPPSKEEAVEGLQLASELIEN